LKKLVIYGASYPEIVKLVDSINRVNPEWEILGFIDDKDEYENRYILNYPVLGKKELIKTLSLTPDVYFFNNYYGKLNEFKKRLEYLISNNCKIPTLIHPSVDLNYVKVGKGCVITDGCVIGSNVEIGNYVTIRLKSIISHDVKIEDYVLIAPGANIGSCVTLKEGSFIGAGATIMRTKTVGVECTVGAGAAVVENTPDRSIVVGVPAKKLKKNLFRRIIRRINRDFKKLKKFLKSKHKYNNLFREKFNHKNSS